MVNFDQVVSIEVKLDTSGFSKLGGAIAELEGAQRAMEGLNSDFAKFEQSFTGFRDSFKDSDLDDIMPDFDEERANRQADALDNLGGSLAKVSELKDEVDDSNQALRDSADDSTVSLSDEERSLEQLLRKADGASEAKDAFRKSNRLLSQQINRDSIAALEKEHDAMLGLRSLGVTDADIMREFGDAQEESSEDVDRNTNSMRRLVGALDETDDSLRAANKAGDLLDDKFGSMSINLGAFTLALRNFLTQVPMLLAGLGAIGAAAGGVAGAFLTAGTAIGATIGAGVLAQAQSLNEQYKEIEGTGEALQVMLRGLKDLFLDAVSPLTENEAVVELWERAIEGIAGFTNMVSHAINDVMPEIEETFDSLGSQLEEPLREFVEVSSFMFVNLKDEFVDMTVGMIEALNDLIRFTTIFVDGMTESNRVLNQFIDSVAELSKLGRTIFGGLAPIVMGFLQIMEAFAAKVNSLNSEFVASALTFALVVATINKAAGVFGSFITIIPNLIFGLVTTQGSIQGMISAFGGFMKQHGSILTGFVSLTEAVEDFGQEMAIFSLRTALGEESLDSLDDELAAVIEEMIKSSQSIDHLNKQLGELALESDVTEEELEDVSDELEKLALKAEIADESTDDIDFDTGEIQASNVSGGAPTIVPAGSGGIIGKVASKLGRLKTVLSGVGTLILSGEFSAAFTAMSAQLSGLAGTISTATGSISSMLGPLAIIIALIGGLAVGIIGNFDKVMSALGTTMSAMGSLMSWLGGLIMGFFIDVWDALHDVLVGLFMIVKPFIDLFKALGLGGEEASSGLSTLAGIIEFIFEATGALLDVVGSLLRVLGTIVGGILMLMVDGILLIVSAIQMAINAAGDFLSQFGLWRRFATGMSRMMHGLVDVFWTFIDVTQSLPSMFEEAMTMTVQFVQDGFNKLVEKINNTIENLNKIPGVDFDKVDKVEFGVKGSEGLKVGEDELKAGTEGMREGATAKQDKNITYEEDNSTNIDQTVNADPEDKAQISRIAKDAIEEANSFSRRQQGGQ